MSRRHDENFIDLQKFVFLKSSIKGNFFGRTSVLKKRHLEKNEK